MSRQDSTDLVDLVDVGDLLDTLGDDEEVDAALAAAVVATSPSFGDPGNDQDVSHSNEGESEAMQHSAVAAAVSEEPEQEVQEKEEQQDEEKEQAEEEHGEKEQPSQRRPLEVDIDATPLNMQQGYDCFRQLEKLREEQKKQLQLEEEEVEKAKSSYSGKKWAVKQPAGPLRPQEAGELAVACAVKAGGEKMSPREEIEELTRQEVERKKKKKALEAAAAESSPVPVKPLLPSTEAKEEEAAQEETAEGEENKEAEAEATAAAETDEGERKDGDDGGDEKHEDDGHGEEKTCDTGDLEKRGSGQEGAESSAGLALTGAVPGSPRQGRLEDADAAEKANGPKSKTKMFHMFTCFSKKGNVREPHKPPGKRSTTTGERAEGSSTGELSETPRVERKDMSTLATPSQPVFDD